MNNKTTFSQSVKNEIARETDFSSERKRALLSAYLRINGAISFGNKKTNLRLKTDNSKVAKYIYVSLKNLYPDFDIKLDFIKRNNNVRNLSIFDVSLKCSKECFFINKF